MDLQIICDGSFDPKTKIGAAGGIILEGKMGDEFPMIDKEHPFYLKTIFELMSSNDAELWTIRYMLNCIPADKKAKLKSLTINTDSEYAINLINQIEPIPKSNTNYSDLLVADICNFLESLNDCEVTFNKVAAHVEFGATNVLEYNHNIIDEEVRRKMRVFRDPIVYPLSHSLNSYSNILYFDADVGEFQFDRIVNMIQAKCSRIHVTVTASNNQHLKALSDTIRSENPNANVSFIPTPLSPPLTSTNPDYPLGHERALLRALFISKQLDYDKFMATASTEIINASETAARAMLCMTKANPRKNPARCYIFSENLEYHRDIESIGYWLLKLAEHLAIPTCFGELSCRVQSRYGT